MFAFLFELKNELNTPHHHATIEKKNSYIILNLQKFGSIPIDCCCVRELSLVAEKRAWPLWQIGTLRWLVRKTIDNLNAIVKYD